MKSYCEPFWFYHFDFEIDQCMLISFFAIKASLPCLTNTADHIDHLVSFYWKFNLRADIAFQHPFLISGLFSQLMFYDISLREINC